jgi:hypothetical protein
VSQTLEIFREDDGHDAALFGTLRYTYFRDRLDRVFSCGRYELGPDGSPTNHLDVLQTQLSAEQIETMPRLTPGLVVRANLNGSPGWAFERRRLLLAACVYGHIQSLPWPRKSPTKQRVAKQTDVNPAQESLFADFADEEVAGLEALLAGVIRLDMETFVVAHSLEVVTHDMELVLGRPRHNVDGGKAWHWAENLLTTPPGDSERLVSPSPPPTDPDAEPDAPVKLRRSALERPNDAAGGA